MLSVLHSVLQAAVLSGNLQLILLSLLFTGYVEAAKKQESNSTYPAPIAIPPSQDWDGNDGPWSSFAVQIGTPPQSVKVQISTAATQTWAIVPEGCVSGDPTTCAALRGNLFNHNLSSTYLQNIANLSSDIYDLGLESSLGYTGKGRYGFDDIKLGWQGSNGPSLKNQTVAGVATKSFFMGLFGLTPRPSNFTSYNEPIPSFMENLKNQSLLASLSWAYTAGNQYRLNSVLGSLTLGGYDTSKFDPNNISFPLSSQDSRDLTVQVEKITTSDNVSLLVAPIGALLDSTIPYIYLPDTACTAFETAFGITWNETSQLYLINDTQHTLLSAKNPSITFTLGDVAAAATVDISLPYSAFALTASYPLAETPTRYFPLKRAANGTQYTLGRAFFQEAYVIADYDRRNFSVSQCKWDARATQNIVAILPPFNGTDTSSTNSTTLPTGAIAGIAVGAVLILALILLYFFWLRPRKRKQKAAELESSQLSPDQQGMTFKPELDSTPVTSTYTPLPQEHKYTPPVEIGIHEPVYEMAASEEVAAEMTGMSPPRELADEMRMDRGRRWSRQRRSEMLGVSINPRGSVNVSSVSSSPRLEPGSQESPIVSPSSFVNNTRH